MVSFISLYTVFYTDFRSAEVTDYKTAHKLGSNGIFYPKASPHVLTCSRQTEATQGRQVSIQFQLSSS